MLAGAIGKEVVFKPVLDEISRGVCGPMVVQSAASVGAFLQADKASAAAPNNKIVLEVKVMCFPYRMLTDAAGDISIVCESERVAIRSVLVEFLGQKQGNLKRAPANWSPQTGEVFSAIYNVSLKTDYLAISSPIISPILFCSITPLNRLDPGPVA